MNFRNRALACAGAGAVGMFAVGAFAAPALADDSADLEVKVTGTTIAADASGKFTTISLINNSEVAAKGILVTVDISKLDAKKIQFVDDTELIPADQDNSKGQESLGAGFWFPVKVSQGATGPVTLTGGTVTVIALGEAEYGAPALAAVIEPAELPENVQLLGASEFKDIDRSDNTDEFSVFVAGSGGGGGGGLPVTGVQAGVIGGIGLAVVVVGGALFMAARRRRWCW